MHAVNRLKWSDARLELQAGATVITANRRQARMLAVYYADQQTGVWPAPDIVPWGVWLQREFTTLQANKGDQKNLLTHSQSEWLWLQVVQRHVRKHPLLNPPACARQALDAWQLIQDFELTERDMLDTAGAESEVMLEWAGAYRYAMQACDAVDIAQLPRLLREKVEAGEWLPKAIIAYGFTRLTPAQQQLIFALQTHGVTCNELHLKPQKPLIRAITAHDEVHELELAAEWARDELSNNPEQTIQIVIPDLIERRHQVHRVFKRVLHPECQGKFTDADTDVQLFDLTAGTTIAEQPLIDWLLNWLGVLDQRIAFTCVSRILRSNLLAQDEQQAAAEQELKVREQQVTDLTLAQWLTIAAEQDKPWHSPILFSCLRNCQSKQLSLQNTYPVSEAVQRLQKFLQETALQGIDSTQLDKQRRVLVRWHALLDAANALAVVSPRISIQQLIVWLRRQANLEIYQLQRRHARIQISGVLEALGQSVDRTWVMQLSVGNWPQAAKPNPLLPIDLQRRLDMPRASARFELEYARQALTTLCQQSHEVVFSYACQKDDVEQLVSPLLFEWVAEAAIEEIDPTAPVYLEKQLEKYTDVQATQLAKTATTENITVGGSWLLKAQTSCPFQATAIYRLGSELLEPPQPGIGPRLHGTVLHAVLQRIWKQLLPAQLDSQLICDQVVEHSVDSVLDSFRLHTWVLQDSTLTKAYARYLCDLLQHWLMYEGQRGSNFEVIATEQQRHLEIGPLRLHVKLDRVDRLADGSHLYIDYKSSKGRLRGWYDDGLSEPQLPLYAFSEATLAGIATASLHPAEMGFSALTDTLDRIPDGYTTQQMPSGRKTTPGLRRFDDLRMLQQHWKLVLEELAQAAQAGDARVVPIKNACQFCQRQTLCRIDDSPLAYDG